MFGSEVGTITKYDRQNSECRISNWAWLYCCRSNEKAVMAGKLLEKWKLLSKEDETYIKEKTYSQILSVLRELSE